MLGGYLLVAGSKSASKTAGIAQFFLSSPDDDDKCPIRSFGPQDAQRRYQPTNAGDFEYFECTLELRRARYDYDFIVARIVELGFSVSCARNLFSTTNDDCHPRIFWMAAAGMGAKKLTSHHYCEDASPPTRDDRLSPGPLPPPVPTVPKGHS